MKAKVELKEELIHSPCIWATKYWTFPTNPVAHTALQVIDRAVLCGLPAHERHTAGKPGRGAGGIGCNWLSSPWYQWNGTKRSLILSEPEATYGGSFVHMCLTRHRC